MTGRRSGNWGPVEVQIRKNDPAWLSEAHSCPDFGGASAAEEGIAAEGFYRSQLSFGAPVAWGPRWGAHAFALLTVSIPHAVHPAHLTHARLQVREDEKKQQVRRGPPPGPSTLSDPVASRVIRGPWASTALARNSNPTALDPHPQLGSPQSRSVKCLIFTLPECPAGILEDRVD